MTDNPHQYFPAEDDELHGDDFTKRPAPPPTAANMARFVLASFAAHGFTSYEWLPKSWELSPRDLLDISTMLESIDATHRANVTLKTAVDVLTYKMELMNQPDAIPSAIIDLRERVEELELERGGAPRPDPTFAVPHTGPPDPGARLGGYQMPGALGYLPPGT